MTDGYPLVDWCSLCGEGYHPHLEIDITDEPTDSEYRWIHMQCKRDHDRTFLEAFDSTDALPKAIEKVGEQDDE